MDLIEYLTKKDYKMAIVKKHYEEKHNIKALSIEENEQGRYLIKHQDELGNTVYISIHMRLVDEIVKEYEDRQVMYKTMVWHNIR